MMDYCRRLIRVTLMTGLIGWAVLAAVPADAQVPSGVNPGAILNQEWQTFQMQSIMNPARMRGVEHDRVDPEYDKKPLIRWLVPEVQGEIVQPSSSQPVTPPAVVPISP